MIRYTIRRLLWGVVVLLALSLATFVLFGPVLQSTAGVDAAQLVAGQHAGPEQVAQTRRFLGLDKPWYEQYFIYMRRVVLGPSADDRAKVCIPGQSCADQVGRLGTSFENSQGVDYEIKQAFPVTLQLSILTAIIWIGLSIPIGVLSALKRGSVTDRSSMVVVLLGQSLPVYYFGLLALYFFGVQGSDLPARRLRALRLVEPVAVAPPPVPAGRGAGAPVRRHLRADDARQRARRDVRGLRPDGARQGRAASAASSSATALRNALLPIVTIFGLDLGLAARRRDPDRVHVRPPRYRPADRPGGAAVRHPADRGRRAVRRRCSS